MHECFANSKRLWSFFSGALVLLVLNNQISVINCYTGGNAPSARSDAAFTVTPQGKVYLFGGTTSGGFSSDLFLYDPFNNTWQLVTSSIGSAPDARSYSTLWMAPDGHLYLYGGYIPQSTQVLTDVWKFNLTSSTWSQIPSSGASSSFGLNCATLSGKLYVFAMVNSEYINAAYVFDPLAVSAAGFTWALATSLGTTGPRFRGYLWTTRLMAVAAAPDGLRVYLFGGGSTAYGNFNDLYYLDVATGNIVSLAPTGSAPAVRGNMGLAAAPDGRVYVYGGHDESSSQVYGDVYVYDPAINTWAALGAASAGASPAARWSAGFATGPDGFYLFGGRDSSGGLLGDFYRLIVAGGVAQWTQCDAQGKSCKLCEAGHYLNADTDCVACRFGQYAPSKAAAACVQCPAAYHLNIPSVKAPPLPLSSVCAISNVNWQYITENEGTLSWTGGLGRLMTSNVQVWACISHRFQEPCCPQAPNDAACYAYFEGNRTFAFWGPDSILQLTGLSPRPVL